ncbi:MAG: hypothetical protein VW338_08650 [Rhodospirillaceae bacterium]
MRTKPLNPLAGGCALIDDPDVIQITDDLDAILTGELHAPERELLLSGQGCLVYLPHLQKTIVTPINGRN